VPKKFQCHHCHVTFKAKHHLKIHLICHFEKKYSCTQCTNVFRSAEKLARHISMLYHYPCEKCSAVMVKGGVQVKCEHRLNEYQCYHCASTFKSKFHVKRHILRHFEQKFKCSKCEQGQKHECTAMGHGMIARHLRGTHTLKKFQCQHCVLGFNSKFSLRRHVLRHFENEFGCSMCEKRFKIREKLTEHMHNRHTNSTKPFQCKNCPRVFKFNRYLSKHIKNMHTVKNK
jgi:KRAB domain-containing zinc finger protein